MKAYLEPHEIQQLEAAARFVRDKLLIRMLFHLGCRVSEVLGIAVADIDFEQGTVAIKHLKARTRLSCPHCEAHLGRAHKFCPGCGLEITGALAEEREHRRLRTLPLDEATLKLLREYVRRGGAVRRDGRELIFGINRHRAWQIVKDCATRSGLPRLRNQETGKEHNVSPHRLRDAFAVMAVKRNDTGDGLRLLQEHLGHQSITTTMRYRKVSGEEQREWYEDLWKEAKDVVKDNASSWQSAWRHVFGDNVVIRTSDRWDSTVKHLGYISRGLQWDVRETLAQAITTDSDLIKASQEKLREVAAIPDEKLTPGQLAHLRLARAIAGREKYPPVAGVHAALIPPASDRVRTAGMYSRTTQEIFIALDQLESGRGTVDTLIHELAHHTSGAEDLSEAHSADMTRLAAKVVSLTAKGEFDELLKEVTW